MMTEKQVQRRISAAEIEEVTGVWVQVKKHMRNYISRIVSKPRIGFDVTTENFIAVREGKLYHNTSKYNTVDHFFFLTCSSLMTTFIPHSMQRE
jgi:hypothetical protein